MISELTTIDLCSSVPAQKFEIIQKNLPKKIKVTHKSLFDDSIEGIKLDSKPVFSVQYHPEANPGPQKWVEQDIAFV